MDERVSITVRGNVQEMGLLWWARRRAHALGLAGHARNTVDGGVEIAIQGQPDCIVEFFQMIHETPTTTWRPGTITHVEYHVEEPVAGLVGFHAA